MAIVSPWFGLPSCLGRPPGTAQRADFGERAQAWSRRACEAEEENERAAESDDERAEGHDKEDGEEEGEDEAGDEDDDEEDDEDESVSRLEVVADAVAAVCETLYQRLQAKLDEDEAPTEFRIEFGITLAGGMGIPVVSQGDTAAAFKVTVKWENG